MPIQSPSQHKQGSVEVQRCSRANLSAVPDRVDSVRGNHLRGSGVGHFPLHRWILEGQDVLDILGFPAAGRSECGAIRSGKMCGQSLARSRFFGICMGHQLLGQAFGGTTFKLKFGHHGGNHPIRFEETSTPPAPAHILSAHP